MSTDASQLRAVRAGFALTQAGLAPWLGVSRGLLALVETGRERLPAHARPWLRPWLAALAQSEAPPAEAPAPLPPAAGPPLPGTAPVWARLGECHYQTQRLGQQCATLRATHHTAARRLAAGLLLRAALPAPTAAEATPLALRRRWLARLLEAAADALAPAAAAGPVALVLLEARRQAWQHEAAWLQAWLDGGG